MLMFMLLYSTCECEYVLSDVCARVSAIIPSLPPTFPPPPSFPPSLLSHNLNVWHSPCSIDEITLTKQVVNVTLPNHLQRREAQ